MTVKKEAKETIRFVDEYCEKYEEVFKEDYRHLENYKYMMIGMISEIKRKSLPEIAKVVGLKDNQILHHFIANSPWKTADLREKRIELIKQAIGEREIVLCIDETGDKKRENNRLRKKTVHRKPRKNRKWDSSSNSVWSNRKYNISNYV